MPTKTPQEIRDDCYRLMPELVQQIREFRALGIDIHWSDLIITEFPRTSTPDPQPQHGEEPHEHHAQHHQESEPLKPVGKVATMKWAS